MEFTYMIVLDTHAWLWWINADENKRGGEVWMDLVRHEPTVSISAISCFEVAWLQRHDRIRLKVSLGIWFEKATTGSEISILPILPCIAEIAVNLPEHHSDPQDRLIIATAIYHKARLVSADRKFTVYNELSPYLVSI
jgi:PIN domain nuclease of toxin-antitoxin system